MQQDTSRDSFWTTIAVGIGLSGIGFVLMLVAHLVAFIGPDTRLDEGWLPYWWSYLWLYPLTTALITVSMPRLWSLVALALCAPPVLYFVAMGVFEGLWRTSSGAWLGALIALALSLLVGYLVSRIRMPGTDLRNKPDPTRPDQNRAGWMSSGSE